MFLCICTLCIYITTWVKYLASKQVLVYLLWTPTAIWFIHEEMKYTFEPSKVHFLFQCIQFHRYIGRFFIIFSLFLSVQMYFNFVRKRGRITNCLVLLAYLKYTGMLYRGRCWSRLNWSAMDICSMLERWTLTENKAIVWFIPFPPFSKCSRVFIWANSQTRG